jgi:hypothetical protein
LLLAGLRNCRQAGFVIQLAIGEAIGVLARGRQWSPGRFPSPAVLLIYWREYGTRENPIGKFVRSKRKRY